MTVFSHSLLIY